MCGMNFVWLECSLMCKGRSCIHCFSQFCLWLCTSAAPAVWLKKAEGSRGIYVACQLLCNCSHLSHSPDLRAQAMSQPSTAWWGGCEDEVFCPKFLGGKVGCECNIKKASSSLIESLLNSCAAAALLPWAATQQSSLFRGNFGAFVISARG